MKTLFTILLFTISLSAFAQDSIQQKAPQTYDEIEQIIADAEIMRAKASISNSAGIAIISSAIIYVNYRGFEGREGLLAASFTAGSGFIIAGIARSFTAKAMLKKAQQKRKRYYRQLDRRLKALEECECN